MHNIPLLCILNTFIMGNIISTITSTSKQNNRHTKSKSYTRNEYTVYQYVGACGIGNKPFPQ